MESNRESTQNGENRTAIQSSDTAPGHISKESKSGYNRETCTLMFVTALFTIAKLWKQLSSCITEE
jgi:hypothetical protein